MIETGASNDLEKVFLWYYMLHDIKGSNLELRTQKIKLELVSMYPHT